MKDGVVMRSMLRTLPTEEIILKKCTGEVIDRILAHVQPNIIIIDDTRINIEENDVFFRTRPKGVTEEYLVLERGFHPAFHTLPAHYQCIVKQITSKPGQSSANPVANTYNSGGSNVNLEAPPVNNPLSLNDEKLFETLSELASSLPNRDEILANIASMKAAVGKQTMGEKYNDFIQSIASHMTVFAPFIPGITKFLTM